MKLFKHFFQETGCVEQESGVFHSLLRIFKAHLISANIKTRLDWTVNNKHGGKTLPKVTKSSSANTKIPQHALNFYEQMHVKDEITTRFSELN